MAKEDKIYFLETSIKSLEGVKSKLIMNREYGKANIPEVEQTIAKLQSELSLLKMEE